MQCHGNYFEKKKYIHLLRGPSMPTRVNSLAGCDREVCKF